MSNIIKIVDLENNTMSHDAENIQTIKINFGDSIYLQNFLKLYIKDEGIFVSFKDGSTVLLLGLSTLINNKNNEILTKIIILDELNNEHTIDTFSKLIEYLEASASGSSSEEVVSSVHYQEYDKREINKELSPYDLTKRGRIDNSNSEENLSSGSSFFTKASSSSDNIANNPPILGNIPAENISEGAGSITGTITSTDVDDNSSATYSSTSIPGFTIDSITGVYSFDANHPSYTSLEEGEVLNIPIAITVTDDNGATDTQTLSITITGTNDLPQITVGDISAVEDVPQIIANVEDIDGSIDLVLSNSNSSNSSISIDGSGNVVYTPNANFNGSDTFTLTIIDNNAGTTTQDITVNVAAINDAPIANLDSRPSLIFDEGKKTFIDVSDIEENSGFHNASGDYTGFTYITKLTYDSFQSWSRLMDFSAGGANNHNIIISTVASSNKLRFDIVEAGHNSVTVNNFFQTGQAVNVAITQDENGNVNIYKDGVNVASGTLPIPDNVDRVDNFIGQSNWSNNGYFDGSFEKLAIFSRALTPTEILYATNNSYHSFNSDSKLLLHLDASSGADNLANNNDLETIIISGGSEITLTAVSVNGDPVAFGGSKEASLSDTFAYDPMNPTSTMPDIHYNGGNDGLHGKVIGDLTIKYALNQNFIQKETSNDFVIDLYGRNAYKHTDDDFDITIYDDNAVSLGTISSLAIDNDSHLRVNISDHLTLSDGAVIASFEIIAHDTTTAVTGLPHNYFTLMEIRAAEIKSFLSTDEDTAITIDARLNDTDIDGNTLNITKIEGQDASSNQVIDIIISSVTVGSAQLINNKIVFTPSDYLCEGEVANISFTYTISDGSLESTGNINLEIIGTTTTGTSTPLIFDLDGDGIETLAVKNGVAFDIDADGDKDKTAWVGADDGLLVRDINKDGIINDGSELFGEETLLKDGSKASDGYEALAELDNNNDGVINSLDDVFSQLKIWKDINSDGITDENELISLKQAKISEISLDSKKVEIDSNGNTIGLTSTYLDSDGNTKESADVWFSYEENINADLLEDATLNNKNGRDLNASTEDKDSSEEGIYNVQNKNMLNIEESIPFID